MHHTIEAEDGNRAVLDQAGRHISSLKAITSVQLVGLPSREIGSRWGESTDIESDSCYAPPEQTKQRCQRRQTLPDRLDDGDGGGHPGAMISGNPLARICRYPVIRTGPLGCESPMGRIRSARITRMGKAWRACSRMVNGRVLL